MGLPVDMDLWKKARRHNERMSKALRAADKMAMGDQKRHLLLEQAAQDARAFAYEIDKVVLAERQGEERGVSFWNVSMLDGSAEPILVG